MRTVPCGLRRISKTSLPQSLLNLFGTRNINMARCDSIATLDDLVPANLDAGDGFRIARLETYGGTGSNIQAISISFETVKVQLRICFYQMIM